MMCARAGVPFGLLAVAVGRPSTVVTVTLSPVIRVTVRGGVLTTAGGAAPACGTVTAVSASTAAPRAVSPRRQEDGKDTEAPSSGGGPTISALHAASRPCC